MKRHWIGALIALAGAILIEVVTTSNGEFILVFEKLKQPNYYLAIIYLSLSRFFWIWTVTLSKML